MVTRAISYKQLGVLVIRMQTDETNIEIQSWTVRPDFNRSIALAVQFIKRTPIKKETDNKNSSKRIQTLTIQNRNP